MRRTVSFCLSNLKERSQQNPLRLQMPAFVQIFSVLEGMSGGLISLPPSTSWQSSSIMVLSNLDIQISYINNLNYIYFLHQQDIMSDYQEDYQYQEQQQEEEDIETKVELQYFEIQTLIREGKWQKAIEELENLYTTAQDNNLKNYKVKILNQLLQIYSKNNKLENIKSTIQRISELNSQQKYTQNSIKSIISILRSTDYAKIKKDVLDFIFILDASIRVKAYLLLLEKAIEEKDRKECESLFELINNNEQQTYPANVLLQLYSLEIKYSKLTGEDISEKIHQIQLKIPTLQTEAYMSQGHISVLKLAIAEIMYIGGNYENSALYLAESFLQKAKYGNSTQLKQILKTNVLISLLIQNPLLRKDGKYNTLYHDASIPFKNEKEVHELISLIDAYQRHDLNQFQKNYSNLNFKPQSQRYTSVQSKLLFKMKKEKLIIMVNSYKSIRFQYIAKRLALIPGETQRLVFELIVDQRIHGRISADSKGKYLQILPERNQFLQIQAENLKELSKRYLSD